jgi:hypothetical protein
MWERAIHLPRLVTAGEGAGKLDGVIGAQGMRTAEISRAGDN